MMNVWRVFVYLSSNRLFRHWSCRHWCLLVFRRCSSPPISSRILGLSPCLSPTVGPTWGRALSLRDRPSVRARRHPRPLAVSSAPLALPWRAVARQSGCTCDRYSLWRDSVVCVPSATTPCRGCDIGHTWVYARRSESRDRRRWCSSLPDCCQLRSTQDPLPGFKQTALRRL